MLDTILGDMTGRTLGRLSSGLLLVLFLFVVAQPLLADTIYFRDGREANGKILSQSSTQVTIQTSTGKWTYDRADVMRIDYDPVSPSTAIQSPTVSATTALPVAPGGSEPPAVEQKGIEIGGSLGLLGIGSTSLTIGGAFVSIWLSDAVALRVDYYHAGLSAMGLEILGIDILEGAVMLDLAPKNAVSAFMLGGAGSLAVSSILEEGNFSGTFLLAGAGVRLDLFEFMTVRAGYVGRFNYGIIHSGIVEVIVRF
jgi:hypothetical protein